MGSTFLGCVDCRLIKTQLIVKSKFLHRLGSWIYYVFLITLFKHCRYKVVHNIFSQKEFHIYFHLWNIYNTLHQNTFPITNIPGDINLPISLFLRKIFSFSLSLSISSLFYLLHFLPLSHYFYIPFTLTHEILL